MSTLVPVPMVACSATSGSTLVSIGVPADFFLPVVVSFNRFVQRSDPIGSLVTLRATDPTEKIVSSASSKTVFNLGGGRGIVLSSFFTFRALPDLPLP